MAEALADVPDPRQKRGVRHPWPVILLVIGAAMLAGQKQVHAIAHWVFEHTPTLLDVLDTPQPRLPSEGTLRRALIAVDLTVLEARLARLVKTPTPNKAPTVPSLRGQSLDGKQIRGAGKHGRRVHLLAVAHHQDSQVVGQVEVAHPTNEIGAAPALLKGLDLKGTVTTVDAFLAQRALAEQIRAQGGDYLMVIKGNQPETCAAIAEVFATQPWLTTERDEVDQTTKTVNKGHGRLETRVLEATTLLNDWVRWPGVAQVLRRRCRRVQLKTGEITDTTTYAVTSLTPKAVTIQRLATLWRGHWSIENRSHYVRDVTFGEDAGHGRSGSLPQALAALRNALVFQLRQAGWTNLADALRHFDAHPTRALALLTIPLARL